MGTLKMQSLGHSKADSLLGAFKRNQPLLFAAAESGETFPQSGITRHFLSLCFHVLQPTQTLFPFLSIWKVQNKRPLAFFLLVRVYLVHVLYKQAVTN